jgi:hypothetical protein
VARRSDAIETQIQAARKALRELSRAVAKLAAALKRRRPASPKGRKLKLTPKRLAALKLQGAYIGHMRHLKPRQKAQVKAIKEKRGMEAAVRAAKRLAGS